MDPRPPFYNPHFNQSEFNYELHSQDFFQSGNSSQPQPQPPSRQSKPNWSREEDEALCKAWMMTEKDPVTGSDQHKTLWERIQTNFQSQPGGTTARNSNGLMNRFSTIHGKVNKFSAYYKIVQDNPISGFDAEDLLQTVKKLYKKQEGVNFKLDHCWNILRHSSKWHNHCTQQEKQKSNQQIRKRGVVDLDINDLGNCSESVSTTRDSSTPGESPPASVNLEDDDSPTDDEGSHDLPRPLGQKAAKKGNNKNKSTLHVHNLFVTEAKLEISLAQERTKQLEIESRERMAKYENERAQMEFERAQVEFERDMMRQDPNKAATEEAKAWIIAQQKAILNKFNQRGDHM